MEELTKCRVCGGPAPPAGDGSLYGEAGEAPSATPSAALVAYRNKSQWRMLGISCLYLALTVAAWAKGWESNTKDGLEWWIVDWLFSGVFLWDYYKRWKYVGRGRRLRYCFELANLFDILVIVSPALVPLGVTSLGVVRIVRVVKVVWMALTTKHDTGGFLRRLVTQQNVRYALNLAIVVSVLAFVVVQSFETTSQAARPSVGEGTQMTSMLDAGWWLAQTVTSVGYGDIVVRTAVARFFGIILMATGVIALSLSTAWVASIFIGKEDDKEHAALMRGIDDIRARLPRRDDDEPPKAST
jgi:Ion transport protein